MNIEWALAKNDEYVVLARTWVYVRTDEDATDLVDTTKERILLNSRDVPIDEYVSEIEGIVGRLRSSGDYVLVAPTDLSDDAIRLLLAAVMPMPTVVGGQVYLEHNKRALVLVLGPPPMADDEYAARWRAATREALVTEVAL